MRRRWRATAGARAAEAAARHSYGKLLAFLAARTGDVAGAEDALSDAFAAALATWPTEGVPANARGLAADRGAAQGDRRGAPAPHAKDAGDVLPMMADELTRAAMPTDRRSPTSGCA